MQANPDQPTADQSTKTATEPQLPPVQPADQTVNQKRTLPWWRNWKFMVVAWILIGVLIWVGKKYHVDSQIIGGSVFLIGLLSNAFAWMLSLIATVPLIGPLIVKVLSLGFIWLLNAVGSLVSYVAIRRGYSKDVLTYKGVTLALIIGIVIGFVLGKAL